MQKLGLTLMFVIITLMIHAQERSFEGQIQIAPQKTILNEQFKAFQIYQIDAGSLSDYLQSKPEQIRFTMNLGDEFEWDLLLAPNEIRTSDYQVNLKTAEGIVKPPKSVNKSFNGYVQGTGGGTTALTVDNNFIYGFIQQNDELFFIEPLYYFIPGAADNLFVVYAQSNVISNNEHKCGADELEHNQKIMAERLKNPDKGNDEPESMVACYDLELAIAADYSMFTKYGSVTGVENHTIGVMNNVQTNYDDEFTHEITFVIVTHWISDCNTCDPWTSSTNAGTLLGSFRTWGNGGGFGVSFDIGQLWTNRNFNGSTIGIAYLNGLCNSLKYHCIQDYTSSAWGLRVVTAHEIGHNLSSGHDGGSGFIMSPVVNNTNTWSAQSQNAINSYVQSKINSGCLQPCAGGAPPVAAFSSDIQSGCIDFNVNFFDNSTGATSWLWTFPGGIPSTSTDENPTVLYSTTGTFDVTLEVTNAFGSNTITETNYIFADDVPATSFFVSTADLVATFTNTSTNANSYLWDFGDGTGSTDVDPIHTYTEDGVYVVSLEAFNDCGSTIVTEVVTIVTPPFAFFTSDVTLGCVPLAVQFYNQSSSNATSWDWVFTNGSPDSSNDENPIVIYSSPGFYDVSLTVSNAAGSNTYTEVGYIEVLDDPTAGFTYTVTNDTIVQFTNTSTAADSYLWDFGDGTSSTDVNPMHTYSSSGSYTVTLTATNPCDAPSVSMVIEIEILAPPVAGFLASVTSGCADLAVTFTDQSTNADSWAWSFPGASPDTSTAQNPTVTYTSSGSYDVTLIVSNSLGNDTLTQNAYINVDDVPVADFQITIDGTSVTFNNNTTAGDTYAWDFGDGNSSTLTEPVYDFGMDGTYTVQLIATNSCGNDTTSQIVVIVTPPIAAFSSDINGGCADLIVNFTDQSSANATNWSWIFTGGTPSASTDQNPTVTYTTAGTFDVELTVSNSAGMNTITLAGFIVVDDVPSSGFTASATGNDVTFNNTTTNGSTYAWDFGDGNTSTDTNPMNTYSGDGTYTVQLIATNACGNDTTTQNVLISTTPVAAFAANNTSGCVDFTVNFTDQSSANSVSWAWTFTGGNPASSTDQNPTVTYTTAGTYDVELTVSNAEGVTNTITQTAYINVDDVPESGFSSSVSGVTANFTNSSTNASSYAWDFGDGNTSTDADPSNDYTMDGTYTVQLIATNPCGNDTTTQSILISTTPVAGFSSDATSGCVDLTINFSDDSSPNTTSWDWSFPGGTPSSSTQENPSITYTTVGAYDVILTVSNAEGLDNTITQVAYITVDDVPASGFSSSVSGMDADFTNSSTNADSYEWDFGDGNSSTATNPSNTYAADGTYTVQLIAINDCGNDTTTQTVLISNAPVAGFSSDATSGCVDLTINFSDDSSPNTTSWDWSFPGGIPSSSTQENPSITYTTAGAYDVILTVSNAEGLDNTITQVAYITVDDVPASGFSSSVSGMDADFTNSSTNADSYEWDFGDGNSSTSTNPSNTYDADGTYTVQLIAINDCGNDTTTQTVLISNAPVAGFSSDATSGCVDLTINFSDDSSPNTTSWDWSFPGGTPSGSTQENPSVTYTTAGAYDVILTVSNAEGLDNTITQVAYITVDDIPASGFSSSVSGMDADFTNSSTNADSYEWDFGDGNSSTATNPSNTYAADGTYTVQLIAINDCGNDTTTQTIIIATAPSAAFTADVTTGCAPFTVNFTDQSSPNTTGWDWTFGGGSPGSSTSASPSVTYSTPGIYSVTLEVSNGVGTDQITQTNYIEVLAAPTADFNSTITGTSVDFNNNSANANDYSWDFGDGNTSTSTNPSNAYPGDGVYTVQLIASGDCGDDTTSQIVTIVTAPIADFTANAIQGCTPLTVDFTDMSTPNTTDWNWSMPGATPATSNLQNPSVTYNTAGTYTVVLEVSNAAGANTITKTNYIVVDTEPTAGFGNTVAGTTATFTNSSTNATSYTWDFGDGNGSSDTNPSHTYGADGTYTVILTASNDCGDVTFTETIEISTDPVAGFIADITIGCGPLTVNFTDQSSPNTTTWDWTFGGATPGSSTEQNPSVVFDTPGSYAVTLVAGSATGSNTFTQTAYITVLTTPSVSFTSNTVGTTTTFSNTTTGANSYFWDFGDGTDSTDPNPQHTYLTDGTYTVTLTATNDCGSVMTTETLVIVTAPTAAFTANTTTGCVPFEVTFIDQSSDNSTEWLWTIDGGSPASSTDQNPVVTFSTPGTYSITLQVTNAAGSNTYSEINYIVVNDVPVATFTSTQNLSTVDFNNTSTNATSYSWDFGDGEGSTLENPSHSYITAGTFEVVLTATNDCGSVTFTETIVIESAPSVAFTASVTSGCAPLEVTFTDQSSGNIISWDWTFEGVVPGFSTEQNPTVTYNTPGVYSVTLEATTAGGTESFTQTGYITVLDGPTAGFTIGGTGPDYTFSNTSTNGDTYLWSFGDGSISSDENPTYTYTMSGTYTVSLTTTNACGSETSTQQITVVVVVAPVAAFDADVTSGCAPLVVNYNNLSTPNADSWLWTFEGGIPATSTDENPQVTYSAPGNYTVTLTATNSAGDNTATETSYIVVTEAAPLSGFNTTVTGSDVSFENTSSGATTYDWDFGDGNGSTMENPTYTYMEDGTYLVTLIVTNGCGTSEVTESIVIATLPEAGFSMDVNTGCAPLAISFTDASSNNTVSWAWEFPGGTPATSSDQNPIVSYATPGVYDVTLVVTNAQGSDTEVQASTITIEDVPTADFTFSGSDLTIDFASTSTGATTYDWTFGDGDVSMDMNPSHTYTTGGDFEVQLIVTNPCGADTLMQIVSITGDAPSASFTGTPLTGCSPMTVTFTDESTGAATWAWEFEGGTPATSGDQNPVVVYDTPGTYPVSLSVSNPFGSNSITQVGYIVVETVPVADFTYVENDAVATFTNNSTGAGTYLWDFGDGESSTLEDPVHAYTETGSYTITLTVANDCGTSTFTDNIEVVIISTELPEDVDAFKLYPNPNNGSFYLEVEAKPTAELQVQLYDVIGRRMMNRTFDFNSGNLRERFDMNELAAGTYIVQLNLGNNLLVRKLIVE